MDIARAAQIVAIVLSPTLAVGAVVYAPRAIRAFRRALTTRRRDALRPDHPPIEQLAADLRRLLWRHDRLKRSSDVAMRVGHMHAVEAAVADCAFDAARALGIACPPRAAHTNVPTAELRRILRALAEAGLVLPPAVDLLAEDRRL
jgi:hypothetical protein